MDSGHVSTAAPGIADSTLHSFTLRIAMPLRTTALLLALLYPQVAGSPPPLWGGKAPPGRSFGKDKDKGKAGDSSSSSVGSTASAGRGAGAGSTGGGNGNGRFGIGKKSSASSPRRHSSSGSSDGKFPPPPPPGAVAKAGRSVVVERQTCFGGFFIVGVL